MTRISPALRQFVQQRANRCCEYCGRPNIEDAYPFHLDHIVALKHGGTTAPDNLAYACFQCNSAKGSNIAGMDDHTGQLASLFNPRVQRWEDHFRFEGGVIAGLTPTGRVTSAVLRMNEPEDVEIRSLLIELGQWGEIARPG